MGTGAANGSRGSDPRFLLGLIAPTVALERRCLGILPGRVLCSCILCGPDLYPCILLPLDPCSGFLHGSDLCLRILHAPDLSLLLHGPDLWRGILHNLRCGILNGLYGPDRCSGVLFGRPSLELLEQGFS